MAHRRSTTTIVYQKENTRVAADTIFRSFFEVEEKNDIVSDGEFALQRCRRQGELAARSWPAKKR